VRYEPFQGSKYISIIFPGLSLRSNPGLELTNTFGVITRAELTNTFGVITRGWN
jgi:hypothetical protein